MKQMLFCLSLLFGVQVAFSQPLPDSIVAKYKAAKTEMEKGACLLKYSKTRSLTDPKTKADILLLKTWFEKQNDETGKNYTNLWLAGTLGNNGDYPAALDLLFS